MTTAYEAPTTGEILRRAVEIMRAQVAQIAVTTAVRIVTGVEEAEAALTWLHNYLGCTTSGYSLEQWEMQRNRAQIFEALMQAADAADAETAWAEVLSTRPDQLPAA